MEEAHITEEDNKSICCKCSCGSSVNLEEIEIITYFQPIISTINSTIAGFESLCRGICNHCGCIIPPFELFKMVETDYDLFNLDLKARKNAFKIFSKFLKQNSDFLLFLNFDAKLIEKGIDSPETVVNLCKDSIIKPNNIIIEITESKPCDIDILKNFVGNCRKYGFLIALDDVGSGYSNFDRIATIKPDIIKLDRSLISDLDKDYNKKVIFRSISRLSTKLGMLLLSEGVETENEIVYSLELGADLLQGFYFAIPGNISPKLIQSVEYKLSYVENVYKKYKIKRIKSVKKDHQAYEEAIEIILGHLAEKNQEEFDDLLENHADKFSFIESLYIINSKGFQITDSHSNNHFCNIKPKIFKILKKGDSHYYKEYFYLLHDDIFNKFTTDSYLSFVTGNLCKTIATKFNSKNGKSYVLCMNIKREEKI